MGDRLPARERRPVWRWIERVLLAMGVVCLGWSGFVTAQAAVYRWWADAELERMIERAAAGRAGEPDAIGTPGSSDVLPAAFGTAGGAEPAPEARVAAAQDRPAVLPGEEPARMPAPPKPGALIGRLEIPRLRISAPVRHGTDDRSLTLAVGHIPGTPLPGVRGNAGLAGHRDTFFRSLEYVQKDDEVRVTTPAGVIRYAVESTKIVRPTDVWVLDERDAPSLTLVTCYPFRYVGSAPLRFIVWARRVDDLRATN